MCVAWSSARFHRLLQPALELTPVHQTGQRIVAGLIGHLSRQAALLGNVVQHGHGAHQLTVWLRSARHQLHGMLSTGFTREQQRLAAR